MYNRKDKFGIRKYYSDFVSYVDQKDFLDYCVKEGKKADIIHVHSLPEIVIKLRKKFGTKKIFLHYHGTDLRKSENLYHFNKKKGFSSNLKKNISSLRFKLKLLRLGHRNYFNLTAQELSKKIHMTAQESATKILVSTPDLLYHLKNAVYLPNPIDLEHFSSKTNFTPKRDYALIINNEATDTIKSLEFCKNNDIKFNIHVHDRINEPLMYHNMPDFLRRFSIYIDIRFVDDILLKSMSMTGLESLACGIKVLDYNLKILEKFPENHVPKKVIETLLSIYSN